MTFPAIVEIYITLPFEVTVVMAIEQADQYWKQQVIGPKEGHVFSGSGGQNRRGKQKNPKQKKKLQQQVQNCVPLPDILNSKTLTMHGR